MAKQKKQDFALTVSGYEYDKELSRVPIKVFPALQALVANQHDLIEVFQKHEPEQTIFLEAHMAEMVQVEETIQKEYAKYCTKREEQKRKREENGKNANNLSEENENNSAPGGFDEFVIEGEAALDKMAADMSPGLPSAKFEQPYAQITPVKNEEKDVRRIAIGASIKALNKLLGRQLTNQEISVIETQVDSFL
ncbi:MAG: hypothetical protein PHT62_12735 [Desulfotomaculaceae bacterium]|nr:hypothetical protein [Desulfotomaculaceae bacterium]